MEPLIHGGDLESYRLACGREPMDFSANVSPLGLPAGVREAIIHALDEADRYPDPLCRRLRAAIAAHDGVKEEQIFCGNGAAEVIDRLVQAKQPRRALVPAPAFAEYARSLARAGCLAERYALEEKTGFAVREDVLRRIDGGLDMIFLCEPNNPTGCLTSMELLCRIAGRCARTGTLLVIDECFNGFLDDPEAHTLLPLLDRAPVYILRAFTKLWGMAGVRLGYGLCADRDLQDRLYAAGPPWSVSSLAQAAGIAALKEDDYAERLRGQVRTERAYLTQALRGLGLTVYPAQANFLLLRAEIRDLAERMAARGVLIRPCGSFEGLDARYNRVAVRTHEENVRLVQEMEACLHG